MEKARINAPDAMHLLSLSVENVRAFAERQELRFRDGDGRPNRWCLILGENGVGKTTLLQTLAVMRPIPGFAEETVGRPKRRRRIRRRGRSGRSDVSQPFQSSSGGDVGTPDTALPALSLSENDEMRRFARSATDTTMSVTAAFRTPGGRILEIGVELDLGSDGLIRNVRYGRAAHELASEGPLVIGYGAGRHVGHENRGAVAERLATWSLFSDAVDLYDAEEIIEQLAHAALVPGRFQTRDRSRYGQVLSAVAALLPGLTAQDIEFRGPKVPGRAPEDYGVHISTPSGSYPLSDLSLGYQAVFAWTVDLAYRLHNAFPGSDNPLGEHAIVLIDEIDLHLHPRWQRSLRRHLLAHFPNIQFISTTHSPITAQEAVAHGGTVAVVRLQGNSSVILNDPLPDREWAIDQILTSELFGFGAPLSETAEGLMQERVALIGTLDRSPEQQIRLMELDDIVDDMPSMRSDVEREFETLMKAIERNLPARGME